MNRRSERLDKFINELVNIRFRDGDVKTGVLEYDPPGTMFYRGWYCLYIFGHGRMYFRKSHIRSIRKWKEPKGR
ncbi:hypothetical protein [Butyrivibrio sp.]|uniref:hypothetical protein n=1 Tax=Butyrivibrio sp. TaxID=28121 RepID=UPI0025BDBD30|nr:hypothetical protein [Butyrivibrio sp.]MBQ9302055.1 hypothetical protein [Butyrivibrio sp.]